jgi:hypothetical protein
MSHIVTQGTSGISNFIASAVGLTRESCTVLAAGVTADDAGRKVVLAGTILPANDATATGILFEDVDVTEGDHEGSLIIAGRVFNDRLPVAVADTALPVLKSSGIYFATSDETTRD